MNIPFQPSVIFPLLGALHFDLCVSWSIGIFILWPEFAPFDLQSNVEPRLKGERAIEQICSQFLNRGPAELNLALTNVSEVHEIARRFGDAMTFQGREADIVFISMVADAHTLTALSGEMFEQRFNVAASRAKDRLYLYRSFRREDLRDNDLRASTWDSERTRGCHAAPEDRG